MPGAAAGALARIEILAVSSINRYGDHCIKTYQEYSDLIINDILKLLHIIDYFNCKQNTTLINKYRLRVVLVSMSLIIYKATPDIYHHLLLETPTFTRQHHAKVS